MSSRPTRHYDAALLYREHAGFVTNFLHRLGIGHTDVEDLVRDCHAFMRLELAG